MAAFSSSVASLPPSLGVKVEIKAAISADCFSGALDNTTVAVNSKFIAFVDNTNPTNLTILDAQSNNASRMASSSRREAWHSGQGIKDFAFNPFDPNQVITVAPDAHMKLWDVPEGGIVANEVTNPSAKWKTKDLAALRGLSWHPSIARLVISRSSRKIMLWDLNKDTEIVSSHESVYEDGDISSMVYSYDGSTIYTQSKDKKLRIIDLRLNRDQQIVATVQGHEGMRHTRVAHLGKSPYFATTGHGGGDKAKTRQLTLWDTRKLNEGGLALSSSVQVIDVDEGASYGNQLVPLFDGGDEETGSGLLHLVSKGESLLNSYAFNGADGAFSTVVDKWKQPLEGGKHSLGAALFPRQSLNFPDNEVARILQASASSLRVVSVRGQLADGSKPDRCCKEWYSSTTDGAGPNEDVSVENYMSNGGNATPLRVALDTTQAPVQFASVSTKSEGRNSSFSSRLSASAISSSSTKASLELDAEARIRQVVEEEERLGRQRASTASSRSSRADTLRFKYMRCDEAKLKDCYTDLRVNHNPLLGDCPLLAASGTYWALPWEGAGGTIFVAKHNNPMKVDPRPAALLKAHDISLGDMAFSPFHDNLIASVGADSVLRGWRLPSNLDDLDSYTSENAIFNISLDSPAQNVSWHPTVAGLVASSTHENSVYMHSMDGQEVFRINLGACESSSVINNIAFNPVGSLVALGCKDNAIRIVDPRSASSDVRTPAALKVGRNLRVAWCGDSTGSLDCILSVAAKGSNRHVETWDPRNLQAPLSSIHVDSGAGQLYPFYDSSMQTVFTVGRGDTTLRTYELKFERGANAAVVAKSSEYSTQTPGHTWAGMAMLPKQSCNIADVQCARMIKLSSSNHVIPLSFVLPRSDAQKGLFQDEIFPDVPTCLEEEARSVGDFTAYLSSSGSTSDAEEKIKPLYYSLRPKSMKSASEAEDERRSSNGGRPVSSGINSYKMARIREEQEKAVKDDNFAKLQALAMQRAANHPNLSMGTEEVDSDDNWSDDD